jgi:glycosyltransferase involved in cell wall biosynthesis
LSEYQFGSSQVPFGALILSQLRRGEKLAITLMADKDSVSGTGSPAPLVSFVTPFYNTEEYLSECIESVLRQTHENWEYILLNNCSTDKSAEIAESYARQNSNRIHLLHNPEHLSQVQNFNRIFQFISPESKYCKFVQADDWLFPECASKMVEIAEAHPRVGIVGAYQLEDNQVRLDGLPYPSPDLPGRDVCRLYFLNGVYLFGTPTSLLLRSEIVRSRTPFYDERLSPFEDGHACFELLKTWNFGFVHQVLTFSRRDNDSIIYRMRRFSFLPLLRLGFVVTHGPDCLGKEEYNRCLKDAEREYFLFLGKCAAARHRPDAPFWEFHRKGLASLNYTLDWRLLGKWIPRALFEKTWDTFSATWDMVLG